MHDQITSFHKRIERIVRANLRASLAVPREATKVQQVGEVIYHVVNSGYRSLLKTTLIVLMQKNIDRELLEA